MQEFIRTTWPVKIEGPSTVKAGMQAEFKLIIKVANGCGSFYRFDEATSGFTQIIKTMAMYPDCQICTMNLPERTVSYTFTPSVPGRFYLRFEGPNDANLIDTLIVN